MSQSDYGVRLDPSATLPRVSDSRRTGSVADPTTVARDELTSQTSVISAPNTPFRRDRSLTESHAGRRSVRQPKRHTLEVSTGLQQHHSSAYVSQCGSLRSRGRRIVHECISEIHSVCLFFTFAI